MISLPTTTFCIAAFSCLSTLSVFAEAEAERIFSGPQKGEKLPALEVTEVYGKDAGKTKDYRKEAGDGPLLFIFMHKLTRPSAGLMRTLTSYARAEGKGKLSTRIIWLTKDKSAAEEYLNRARRSLNFSVPLGISVAGEEGPGAYGLNRNVTLTILIADKGKVTANHALVQPGDTDAPKILADLAPLIGKKPPTQQELAKYRRRYAGRNMARIDPEIRKIASGLRAPDLKAKDIKKIEKELFEHIGKDRSKYRSLGALAQRWTRARNFSETGTPEARKLINEWAKKYGPEKRPDGRSTNDPKFDALVRQVIQKDNTAEDVASAVKKLEEYIASDKTKQARLGDISRRVVGSPIFEKGGYGIPEARAQLKIWAKTYGRKTERIRN